jgi:hypothetical protein
MALAGAVVWALAPFAPSAPFRVYAGPEHPPVEVESAALALGKGQESEMTFLVQTKARPVLVISEPSQTHGEVLALRLRKFSKMNSAEQARVRSQAVPGLFHLRPDAFDLPDENAVLIHSLVPVHQSALGPTEAGRLNSSELATIHERVARAYKLNLSMLIVAQARKLIAEAQRRNKA